MIEQEQRQLCEEHKVAFDPPGRSSRVAIALETLHLRPLHGMLIPPYGGVCEWYLWGGEFSEDPDFFQLVCVEHLPNRCPMALRFLSLPPGWRFLTDGNYSDIWFNDALLRQK